MAKPAAPGLGDSAGLVIGLNPILNRVAVQRFKIKKRGVRVTMCRCVWYVGSPVANGDVDVRSNPRL